MKRVIILLPVFLCICIQLSAQMETGETVAVTRIDAGKVRGYIHNHIYTYKGIPYATAKRFEAPQKPQPWGDTVRSSMAYGPVAPVETPINVTNDEGEFAFHHNWGFANEDCLRVNVWTPGISDGKNRPVMVWIHGGDFTEGSSQDLPSYDGENLAKKGDVVVVSLNHRLNILGFLDLSAYGDKYKHSSNAGMLDIEAALKWVKTNIRSFGGNPDNVTIFGQSGGGAKVNTLMAMPSAKGLFQKAVSESGSYPWVMLSKAEKQALALEVLKVLRLKSSEVDSLQNIPYQQLADAGKKAIQVMRDRMRDKNPYVDFYLNWAPGIDSIDMPYYVFSKEAFKLSAEVPLLIGTVKNEFTNSIYTGLVNASQDSVIAYIRKLYGAKSDSFIRAVKKAYPEDTKPTDLIDVDVTFRPGAVAVAEQKSALHAAPVYLYLFTWQSPVLDGKGKAFHCVELPFVFNNISRCEEFTGGGKEAYALADKVSSAWINFARWGNPNYKDLPQWPVYNAANTATMHFDNTSVVRPQMDKELLDLVSQ